MLTGTKMETSKKSDHDVTAQLRRFAHDMSNSIETIIQASYLLGQTKLDANGRRWAAMIESAADEAAQINRGIREVLRSHPHPSSRNHPQAKNEKSSTRRRAS